MKTKKIAFLGAGNMGSAIINALISSGFSNVSVFDPNTEKVDALCNQTGVTSQYSMGSVTDGAEVLVLAVKPQMFDVVLPEIKADLSQNTMVISIAAGKTIEQIAYFLGEQPISRVMPNMAASIGESISAVCFNDNASDADRETAMAIINTFGQAVVVEEKLFSVFSAIGGCSPAFTAAYIDALATSGVKFGLSKDVALKVATQAVLGAAKTLAVSGDHPAVLADKVCSPGGTTIAGLTAMRANGFDGAVYAAVEASVKKDENLK